MQEKTKILITGYNGYIGNAIGEYLKNNDYEIWGLGKSPNTRLNYIQVDLLNKEEIKKAKRLLPSFDTLIHTAALAHGQIPPNSETVISYNVKITKNIIEYFKDSINHLIFTSSVAVYGEDKRFTSVTIHDSLRPSTDYGISKMICEEKLLNSKIKRCTILRLSPVFDKTNYKDVKKRVFLPFFSSVKMVIKPSPSYSLASIDTLTKIIMHTIKKNKSDFFLDNVCDEDPYSQNQLATWFSGKEITFPLTFIKPVYWLTYFFPKKYGYRIRCLYWKLFKDNIYETSKYS